MTTRPKTFVYVDGFNLYYGALRGRVGTRWLNLRALAERVLPNNEIAGIVYCTAYVKERPGKPDQLAHQTLYVKALETLTGFELHKGAYIEKRVRRPLVADQEGWTPDWPEVAFFHDSEEKGSDVNLATRLLVDGYADRYRAAAVISNDGDLKMPLEIVRGELGLPVTVINPHPRRSLALSPNPLPTNARYVQLRRADVAASQFPDTVTTRSGRTITKPSNW
jgi:hypothetical protein